MCVQVTVIWMHCSENFDKTRVFFFRGVSGDGQAVNRLRLARGVCVSFDLIYWRSFYFAR